MQKGKVKYSDNIIGKKFGKLTVLEFAGIYGTGTHAKRLFKCVCDCGIVKNIRVAALVGRKVYSCGCHTKPYQNEILVKYGEYKPELLFIHGQMIRRCHSPKDQAYHNYGGRGIFVCEEWRNDFLVFYDWAIQNGWKKGLQIDRINNELGYSPNNCRITTRTANMRNTRKNHFIEYNGERKCVKEWAQIVGINESSFRQRISAGWPLEKLFIPRTKYPGVHKS